MQYWALSWSCQPVGFFYLPKIYDTIDNQKEWNSCWTLVLEEESPKVKITSLDLKK